MNKYVYIHNFSQMDIPQKFDALKQSQNEVADRFQRELIEEFVKMRNNQKDMEGRLKTMEDRLNIVDDELKKMREEREADNSNKCKLSDCTNGREQKKICTTHL